MPLRRSGPLAVAAVLLSTTTAAPAHAAGSAPPAAAISGLTVHDTANAADWSVQANLQKGNRIYGDRTYTFSAVPAALAGAAWVRDAGDSKTAKADPLVAFTLGGPAAVYLGIDKRSARPSWVDASWSDTGLTETGTTGLSYRLYTKGFAAGPVSLGPQGAAGAGSPVAMYTIAVVPAPSTGPDFALGVAPAGQTVQPGQSATYTVHTSVVAGTPDPIALTASGAPAGATVTVDPATVAAGGDATLTVATTADTPGGTATLTVTGTDAAATHSATATLAVGGTGGSTGYEAEAPANTLFGGAKRRACAFCSGGAEVGNILGHGKPDALQFNGVTVPAAGTYQVTWYYIAGDPNGDTRCGGEPNPPKLGCRPANLVINGGPGHVYQFPDTPDWHTLGSVTLPLALNAGANTIKINSSGADVADLDRIVVATP